MSFRPIETQPSPSSPVFEQPRAIRPRSASPPAHPFERAGPVAEVLAASFPGGVLGVCSETCNPICEQDGSGNYTTVVPTFEPGKLQEGCRILCGNKTCEELGSHSTMTTLGQVASHLGKLPGASSVVSGVKGAGQAFDHASKFYDATMREWTGTTQEEERERTRIEEERRKEIERLATEDKAKGGRRRSHRRKTKRRVRGQKKKQQRKSRKHKHTKRRHSGRKRRATRRN